MSIGRILSAEELLKLPPMLFGAIRWSRELGSPVGDLASGFTILVDEHTVTQFEDTGGGIAPVPGTGVWLPPQTVPAWAAPDEGDIHVVRFNVPNVHLNGFPDGKYRVCVRLIGNWTETLLHPYRRIDPLAWYVSLTRDRHIISVDFQVVQELWLPPISG
jgi:hypothetical protein